MTEYDIPPPTSDVHESWSVKEVVADLKSDLVGHLDKQDNKLEAIDTKLDSKADRSEVLVMATEFRTGHDDHGRRITVLEQYRSDELSSRRTRARVWAAIGSAAGLLAVLAGAIISRGGHL